MATANLPITAGRVVEAVKILNETQIDAVILDVRMPGASGLTLLEYIRFDERWRHLPVLLLTGSHLTEHEERTVARLGAYMFYKPERYETIVGQLNRVVTPATPAITSCSAAVA
jgi:CheY-like chemotaxis protein